MQQPVRTGLKPHELQQRTAPRSLLRLHSYSISTSKKIPNGAQISAIPTA